MKGKLIALAMGAMLLLGGIAAAQDHRHDRDNDRDDHHGKHHRHHDNGRHMGQYKTRSYTIHHRGGNQTVTYYSRGNSRNRGNSTWGHNRRWTNPSHRSTRSGWTRVNGRWVRPSTKHKGYLFSTSHPWRYSNTTRTHTRTRTRSGRRYGSYYSNGRWVSPSRMTNSRTGYVYSNGRWMHKSALAVNRSYRNRNRTRTFVRHRTGMKRG